jgi:hypothetical protein
MARSADASALAAKRKNHDSVENYDAKTDDDAEADGHQRTTAASSTPRVHFAILKFKRKMHYAFR